MAQNKAFRPTDIFASLTFNKTAMRKRLSREIYLLLLQQIEKSDPLSKELAGPVAHAIKEWAIENGATHFTHWVQSLGSQSAEKHEAFITYEEDMELVERFSENQLIQSIPLSSASPSGSVRSNFEARGYHVWDPTSPVFMYKIGKTSVLVIPSMFLSWDGAALDVKTPLIRSRRILEKEVVRFQRLLGNRVVKKVQTFLGIEQEYYLVDKKKLGNRPDLKNCGRTLFGRIPASNQKTENYYFGSINQRILSFMEEVDQKLYLQGIPSKVRHNEIEPGQFEIACLHEECNLATDHNRQLMHILHLVAEKYDLAVIFHEKPFLGLPGSAKHVNWSMGDNSGLNYLEVTASPVKNIIYLLTMGAMFLGVKKHAAQLRVAAAGAGNDHRLGGRDAPPPIMAIYLGSYLAELFSSLEKEKSFSEKTIHELTLKVRRYPGKTADQSDKTRTAPIAFTGNKFEFRILGASQNCGGLSAIINLCVADGFSTITSELEKRMKSSEDLKETMLKVLRKVFQETKDILLFEDDITQNWEKLDPKKGIEFFKNTPDVLSYLCTKENLKFYSEYGFLSNLELEYRRDIFLQEYVDKKLVEFKLAVEMIKNWIRPALLKQLCQIKNAFYKDEKFLVDLHQEFFQKLEKMNKQMVQLEKNLLKSEKMNRVSDQAAELVGIISESYKVLRVTVDEAEAMVATEIWPFPDYRSLLNTK